MSFPCSPRLTRLGRRMCRLCDLAFWLLGPGIALYVLVLPDQLPGRGWGSAYAGPLPPLAALAVIAVLEVAFLPAFWGLRVLRGLFAGYAEGAVFTPGAAAGLRRFGLALLAAGLAGPPASVLLSAALALEQPAGARGFFLTVSTADPVLLGLGAVMLVLARAMAEAVRLAEENAAFV